MSCLSFCSDAHRNAVLTWFVLSEPFGTGVLCAHVALYQLIRLLWYYIYIYIFFFKMGIPDVSSASGQTRSERIIISLITHVWRRTCAIGCAPFSRQLSPILKPGAAADRWSVFIWEDRSVSVWQTLCRNSVTAPGKKLCSSSQFCGDEGEVHHHQHHQLLPAPQASPSVTSRIRMERWKLGVFWGG